MNNQAITIEQCLKLMLTFILINSDLDTDQAMTKRTFKMLQ